MNAQFRSRGIETRMYTDAKTGRTVWQITDNADMESKHAYYDISPWSHDGRLLALSSARADDLDEKERDNAATRNGTVCVLDAGTFEIFEWPKPAFYTSHTGSFPVWHPRHPTLYFRAATGGTAAVNVETGERTEIPGGMRQISPDGTLLVDTDNESTGPRSRPQGVYTRNTDGSGERCIVTTAALYEMTPNRDAFALEEMTVGNTKWTPDGGHLLVAMWVKPQPEVRRSIYVVGRDGSDARWLTHFGHHHSWTPKGDAVLFNDFTVRGDDGSRSEPRMHLIDFDGANRRIVIDRAIGSHPIMDPAGKRIADSDREGIYLVHIAEQRVERLAAFTRPFDMTHRGTHPHCLWNPDGAGVLYNSAQSGHSEVYIVSAET